MSVVRIQTEPFDTAAVLDELRAGNPGIGALVSFTGLVRDIHGDTRVEGMTLEHYPGMTEKALQSIVAEAESRWELQGVRVIHRVGELEPGDPIVLVATASAHRRNAFAACELIMDYLKTRAPFWKKERTPDGERWVEARESDVQATRRWKG